MPSPPLFLLLLVPMLLEATGVREFAIAVPGSPLSLGGLGFVIFGLSAWFFSEKLHSAFFAAFLLIFFGAMGGAFFSENLVNNLSAATAQLLFVFAAYGVALELCKHNERLFLLMDACMVVAFLYWSYYVLDKTLLSGNFVSYTKLSFTQGPSRTINHHVPGFHISVAATYLAARFSPRSRSASYAIMGAAILCCLLIESRSNTLFSVLALGWLIVQQRKANLWYVLLSMVALYIIFNLMFDLLGQYAFLNQRFDTTDAEYQSNTTFSRIYLYQNFLPTFAENPLGKGLENPRILFEYTYLNPHNQYLTYILAGGVVAALGVFIFFRTFFRVFFGHEYRLGESPAAIYILPLKGGLLVLFGTLLTIELGGAMFIVGMALLMFLEMQCTLQLRAERRARLNTEATP